MSKPVTSRYKRELVLLLAVIVLFAAVALRAPSFVDPANLASVASDGAILLMMALAQACVLLVRGLDLSVAANLAFTGMVAALVSSAHADLPIPLIIAMSTALGCICGIANGVLIAFVGIPPIVVTLGTLAIYRGLIYVVSHGKWITTLDMTEAFLAFPKQSWLGLSSLVWIGAAVTVALAYVLTQTEFGRRLYAVGGNPKAAVYAGVNVRAVQFSVYVLSGAVSGLCGFLWVSRFGIAYIDNASGYEFTIIAACIIGGVSINGGIGNAAGVLLGTTFLIVLLNALPVINVSSFLQTFISGAVILVAVVANSKAEKRIGKLILPEARRQAARSA